jgi:predicted  nucleic acid-binding Zn-ribbon protein
MTDAATRAREIVEIANSGDDCDCRWSGDPHVLRDFCAVHTRQRDAIVQALTALDAAEARVDEVQSRLDDATARLLEARTENARCLAADIACQEAADVEIERLKARVIGWWSPEERREAQAQLDQAHEEIRRAVKRVDAAEARVAETPETVERVAEALWRDHFPHLSPDWTWAEKCEALPESVERYRSFARVVLRAVREAP